MSAASTIHSGRRAALGLMLDYGTASRPTGGYVYDPGTGQDVAATADLFVSRCKVQMSGRLNSTVEVGARTATELAPVLHLPADTDPLEVGDLFTVTDPHPLCLIPAGRTYRVVAPFEKGLATARRYDVEVVVS